MSYVTPFDLISTPLERYLSQLKPSRRNQSLKMHKHTIKMRYFDVYVSFLKDLSPYLFPSDHPLVLQSLEVEFLREEKQQNQIKVL